MPIDIVETSSFDSEFIVLCIIVDLSDALNYKLCILRIPISDPANVYCDNSIVITRSIMQLLIAKSGSQLLLAQLV